MAQRDRGSPARAAGRARTGGRGGAGGRAAPGRGRTTGRGAEPFEERPQVDLRALRSRLHRLVEPVVTAADLELDGLTVSPAGRRLVVRVTVDGESGIGHDALSDVSRDISEVLDQAEQRDGELTSDSYVLEVSSPGIDRPLTLPRHWRRNIGRLVTVRAHDRAITERVIRVDEAGVSFEGTGQVGFDELGPGRVQVEFTHLAELSDDDFGVDFVDEDGADGAEIPEEDEA
jgi:ribosome maturation factor RimP